MRARRARIALLLGLVPGLLGWAALEWPLTEGLETRYGLDLLFKLRGPRPAPSRVVVVGIDDASYTELGLDPKTYWPRARHAELVRTLAREGARVVAFDVLFDLPGDPAEDAQLALALFDAGNVVLGSTVELTEDPRFRQVQLVEPHAPFAESAAAVAEVAVVPDPDGVIRRAWLVPDDRPSLGLAAYELATHDEGARAERGPRLIDFYGPPRTIPTVSLYQALDPAQYLPPGFFRDKVVFVGANQVAARSFSESKDSFPTPFSGGAVGYIYGVEVHATLAANLLEGRRIDMLPEAAETLLLFALALAATLVFVWLEPRIGFVAFLGAEAACLAAGYLAFTQTGTCIPLVIPAAMQLPAAYVSGLAWYYLTTAREREKIRRAFSFYLSPEMIRRIADNPDSLRLGGEEVQGTAVFTDIAGFTSIAEKMTAHDTASMLNDYFSAITGKIFETGGTLIKYIGDAVFAIWGAPLPLDDHATRACLTALDMGRQGAGEGAAAGRLVTRVGVHTGSMLVGNLGSSQRFDYTAIGDTVNLAARLESLNKAWGTRILISGETLAATNGALVVRALGRVRVVGRAEPVALYELLGANGAETRPGATTLELFDRALAGFTARRFDEAAAGFREVLALCGGQDGPSAFYLATLERYQAEPPPPGWDGVIDFVTK